MAVRASATPSAAATSTSTPSPVAMSTTKSLSCSPFQPWCHSIWLFQYNSRTAGSEASGNSDSCPKKVASVT